MQEVNRNIYFEHQVSFKTHSDKKTQLYECMGKKIGKENLKFGGPLFAFTPMV